MQRNTFDFITFFDTLEELGKTVGKNPYTHRANIITFLDSIPSDDACNFEAMCDLPDLMPEKKDDEFYRDYLDRLEHIQEQNERYLKVLTKHWQLLKGFNSLLWNNKNSLLSFIQESFKEEDWEEKTKNLEQAISFSAKSLEEIQKKINTLNNLKNFLKNRYQEISNAISNPEIKEDTITVWLFYKKESDKDTKMFGTSSGGHVALELCSADKQQNYYISLYPDNDAQPFGVPDFFSSASSFLIGMAAFFGYKHVPKTTIKPGKFVVADQDKKTFPVQRAVTLPCRRPLNFAKVAAWANQLLTTYKGKIFTDTQASQFYYQFYGNEGDNCSSIVLKGLKEANAETVLPYQNNFANLIHNPKGVFDYAKSLETMLQIQELEKKIKSGVNYTTEQRISSMLELAAKQIEGCIYTHALKNPKSSENDPIISNLILINKQLIDLSDRIKIGENIASVLNGAKKYLRKCIQNIGSNLDDKNQDLVDVLKALTALQHYITMPETLWKINLADHPFNDLPEDIKKIVKPIFQKDQNHHQNHQSLLSDQKLFEQNIKINDAIVKINNLRRDNINNQAHDSKKLTVYNNVIRKLKIIQGQNNQNIYFDQYKGLHNDNKNILLPLKKILTLDNPDDSQLGEYDDSRLGEYTAQQITNIKPMNTSNIDIPSKLNPFEWKRRSELLEEKTREITHKILCSDTIGLTQKMASIGECIDNNKPSWWEFWRKDESERYAQLELKAKLLCIIQSFNKGDLDMIDLANKLKDLAKSTPSQQSSAIKLLSKDIIESYKSHVSEFEKTSGKQRPTKQLKKELEYVEESMETAFREKAPRYSQRLSKAHSILFPSKEKSSNTSNSNTPDSGELIDTVRKIRHKLAY